MDLSNKYFVASGVGDGCITIMNAPRTKITKTDALLLAAWLVALADPLDQHFGDILHQVKNS